MIPPYYLTVMTFVCINTLLSLSIGVLAGYAGQVSLGHAAFMGLGAYASAVLAKNLHLSFWLAMPLAVVAAALVGLVLGAISLRLKEDFLAITTMGLNFIVVGVLLYVPFFGRALGIGDIPSPSLAGQPLSKMGYFNLCLLLVAAAIILVWWLQRSWVGLAWRAIREVQDVAEVMGVNVSKFKLVACVISTAIAGLAGSLYAHFMLFITPYDFSFPVSIFILTMAIFGGLGTLRGPVAGAIVLTILPEYLRFIQDYRLLTYGLLLVIIMLFQPQGLLGENSLILNRLKAWRGR
ncbi:MAG: branched-chain amino acid ABC transporter permease [Thermodesulfobacteriota bacterium]